MSYSDGCLCLWPKCFLTGIALLRLRRRFTRTGGGEVRRDLEKDANETEKLIGSVLWLNVKVLGLVLGLVSGLVLFIATNWLIIKGGEPVGPHLQLLSQYFIGYSVSFGGSLVGLVYGVALGALSGVLLGWIYNRIVLLRRGEKKRI